MRNLVYVLYLCIVVVPVDVIGCFAIGVKYAIKAKRGLSMEIAKKLAIQDIDNFVDKLLVPLNR